MHTFGAVLFAKNVARVAAFYEALANLHMTEAAPTWARLGGELNPPDQEWQLGTTRICDGHDPEGNVFQVRAAAD